MQGTHPNTKSTVKFASWLWITTFKRSHLLRIWAPWHTQEAWGWHLRLIVGTAHCLAPTLCFIVSAVCSISFITYVWASMNSWASTQCLDSIFCWEFLPHHVAYQTHPFLKTQLVPHYHQKALLGAWVELLTPSCCFLCPLACILFILGLGIQHNVQHI